MRKGLFTQNFYKSQVMIDDDHDHNNDDDFDENFQENFDNLKS